MTKRKIIKVVKDVAPTAIMLIHKSTIKKKRNAGLMKSSTSVSANELFKNRFDFQ